MYNTLWGTHDTFLYHSSDHEGRIQGQHLAALSSVAVISKAMNLVKQHCKSQHDR